jgi:hypothetical protein
VNECHHSHSRSRSRSPQNGRRSSSLDKDRSPPSHEMRSRSATPAKGDGNED